MVFFWEQMKNFLIDPPQCKHYAAAKYFADFMLHYQYLVVYKPNGWVDPAGGFIAFPSFKLVFLGEFLEFSLEVVSQPVYHMLYES